MPDASAALALWEGELLMSLRVKGALIYVSLILFFYGLSFRWPWLFSLLLLFVLLQSGREWSVLSKKTERVSFPLMFQGLAFLLPLFFGLAKGPSGVAALPDPERTAITAQLLLLFLAWQSLATAGSFFSALFKKGPQVLAEKQGETSFAFILSLALFSANILIFILPHGLYWLGLALATPWICDSLAYLWGSRMGRHKLIPTVSPHKTVEGMLAGFIATVLFYLLLTPYFGRFLPQTILPALLLMALFGFLASLAAQLGDLYESALKRAAGVKDSGNLIPGHGGLLDRIDSTLFVLPLFFFFLFAVELLF